MILKRFFALTASLVILSAALLCIGFSALNTGHQCSGDHCPICMNIDKADSTLRQLTVNTSFTPLTIPLLCSFEYRDIGTVKAQLIRSATPIALKTRKDE